MGMFDYVNYECVCPVCKTKIDGFQSKSGDCELNTLQPGQVSNFYSACVKCGCWIEFKSHPSTDFTMTVTGKKDGERISLPEHTKDVFIG